VPEAIKDETNCFGLLTAQMSDANAAAKETPHLDLVTDIDQ